jgi:hypothetical protein
VGTTRHGYQIVEEIGAKEIPRRTQRMRVLAPP